MALSIREVQRVAALARLELTDEECRQFSEQLGEVVDFVSRMSQATPELPVEAEGLPREAPDLPEACLPLDQLLANAPAHRGPFLAVPRILDPDAA